MNHLTFAKKDKYDIALLIKESSLKPEIKNYYNIDWDNTICLSLATEGKSPVKAIKEDLVNINKTCKFLEVKHVIVCDGAYFKVLTKKGKAEPHYGSIINNGDFDVILCPNYQGLFYNPSLQSKIDLAVNALNAHTQGTYVELGSGIIHKAEYPTGEAINTWLQKLSECPVLACDTETTSLHVLRANLLSISFSWNQHEGIAFLVDPTTKELLRNWFQNYQGTLIFHNATYDLSVLIQQLYMKDYLDYEGLLQGLDVFGNIHDTKIIAYLACNSTAGNELSLKKLALEYAGNYAILDDETPVENIPTDELLRYNLIDTLSTWYVYNKYYPKMVEDNQLDIYQRIMLPSIRSIVHMQLIGFPMDYEQIKKTNKELSKIHKKYLTQLHHNPLVMDFEWILQKEAFTKKNAELKKKVIPIEQFKTKLNPNSGPQVSKLLYEYLGLPVINTTDTGAPSTDKETLESLLNHVINEYQLTEEDLK